MLNHNQTIADFVALLERCINVKQAYQLFQQHAAMLGFDNSVYANLSSSENSSNPIYFSFDNFSEDFLYAYYELGEGGIAQDITVDWCAQSNSAILWEGTLYQKLVKENEAYQLQNNLSHDFGVKYGFTLPLETGSRLSTCAIGLSATNIREREFKADILPNVDLAISLSHYLDMFVRSNSGVGLISQASRTNLQKLSHAERNTLQWLATGHSIGEIADEKLHRSVSSINQHIRSAKTKLKAANRSQLIARAVLLGLVNPV